ncbi:MAG: CAP domain-containing protein [Acidimicrobiales bacterium]|nr:CAP domain-containing protein [Acidimicrobiales bacterium]HRW37882.1 CAP domain-containing protein [Aquihabitans sp.]
MRIAKTVAAVAIATVALAGCLSADQTTVMDQVNAARKSARLAALNTDNAAMQKAQAWSEHMVATGVLEHSGGGTKVSTTGLTNWCAVGENVGYGPSLDRIQSAFMASTHHKANILGSYDRIGTGVAKKGDVYWVTQVFIRSC